MRRVLFAALLWALAACATASPATPPPTLTLIPPTQTPIPTSIPPTQTADPALQSAESLLTATAAVVPTESSESLMDVDPVAAELVALAQQRVAQETGLPLIRIHLVTVDAMLWTDSSLGCPQPDQTYTEVEIDGYRIVLTAGDTTYIFHTDFDRVIACADEAAVTPTAPQS